jgi:predicted DNA-binding protein (MmcQ/YjbR family)
VRFNVEEYCLTKPGAVEDYPFGPEAAVFKVNKKIFALTVPPGKPERINLKCDPTLAIALRQKYPAIIPGYHMNKVHWNTIELDGTVPDAEIKKQIDHSYELVSSSLRGAKRRGNLDD